MINDIEFQKMMDEIKTLREKVSHLERLEKHLFLDEDDMATDSDLSTASQQSIKKYVNNGNHEGCSVELTSDQSVANDTFHTISWDQELFDQDSFWSSGSPTRLTIPADGTYLVNLRVTIRNNSTGYRIVQISLNGSDLIMTDRRTAFSAHIAMGGSRLWKFDESDYIEAKVYQNSGGSIDIYDLDYTTGFDIIKM